MISKRIFSIALTWLAAMSMHAGTYTFKIAHPEEGAKLKLTWCASNEIMDVDVVNGVVTVKKDGFNHGKTKSARIQKRNVFSTDKNEM